MEKLKKFPFLPSNYPHIDINSAMRGLRTGNLFLLCDLKIGGQCANNRIINPELTDGKHYWQEKPPKPCMECKYHYRTCMSRSCPAKENQKFTL